MSRPQFHITPIHLLLSCPKVGLGVHLPSLDLQAASSINCQQAHVQGRSEGRSWMDPHIGLTRGFCSSSHAISALLIHPPAAVEKSGYFVIPHRSQYAVSDLRLTAWLHSSTHTTNKRRRTHRSNPQKNQARLTSRYADPYHFHLILRLPTDHALLLPKSILPHTSFSR